MDDLTPKPDPTGAPAGPAGAPAGSPPVPGTEPAPGAPAGTLAPTFRPPSHRHDDDAPPTEEEAAATSKRALDKRLRALEKEAAEEEERRAEKKAKKKAEKEAEEAGKAAKEVEKQEKAALKEIEEKKKAGSRGVETMFRSAYRVNMDLSALADSKANMLVSVTGLLISIILGTLAPGLDTNPWLRIPTAIFLLFLTAAFVVGVLASRPRVESKNVTLEDVRNRKANLLFFGHFANMPRDQFVVGIRELMENTDELYHTMAVDLYGLGGVLQKKYRLLRISFTVLLIGMGVGVLMFIGTFALRTPNLRGTTVVPVTLGPQPAATPGTATPGTTPGTGAATPLQIPADETPLSPLPANPADAPAPTP
ncbi:MAG TPA: Pycsar system effector family protein [Rhodothermales bacterium]|nr:Pycsar system effector family protein [Rhodothermales bacterium]